MTNKKCLLGVFEISLYMKEGIGRFPYSIRAFWQSFWFTFWNLVLALFSVPYLYKSEETFQQLPLNSFYAIFIARFLIVTAILVIFSYYICKLLKKRERFLSYVIISNWASLIPFVLFVPFVMFMSFEVFDFEALQPYIAVTALYIYSLSGFIAKHVLQMPWQLAAAIAIAHMAINETAHGVLLFVAGSG